MEQILFLGLIFIAVCSYQDASAEKPMMIPRNDQLLIQEGNEIKIKCYSKGTSVQFSFPKYAFMSPRSSHTISTSDDGTSTFLRQRAISLDTGWYACAAKEVTIRNDFKNLNHTHADIAWIYIYVNSSQPFADRHYSFRKSIIVLAGSPAIVPCRPTSPDLNVRLWRNSEIVQLSKQIEFDPRIGFIIKNLVFQDLVIHFHCAVDGVIDKYDLYYSKARGQKPRMEPDVEELAIEEGKELKIECYGESRIQFFFPNTKKKMDSLSVESSEAKIVDDGNGKNTFFRPLTMRGDTGWYGCAEEGINSDIPFRYYIDYTRTEVNWIFVKFESFYDRGTLFGEVGGESEKLTNKVQYEDGNDFLVPCRIMDDMIRVSITCNLKVMVQDEDMWFDYKYGFIVRHVLNNFLMCCSCSINMRPTSDKVSICNRQISEQEKALFLNPGQLMLFTGENLRLSYVGLNADEGTCNGKILITPFDDSARETTSLLKGRTEDNREVCHLFYAWILRNVTKKTENKHGIYIWTGDHREIKILHSPVIDRKSWKYKKLNLQENAYTFVRRWKKSLRLMVDLESFSSEKIQWVSPSNQLIKKSLIYDLQTPRFYLTLGLRSMLVINNLTSRDAGVYRMKIDTSVGIVIVNFTLDVQVPPTTAITNGTQPFYTILSEYFVVSCCAVGPLRPNITWTFLKQPQYPCNNDSVQEYPLYEWVANGSTGACSHLNMNTDTSGILSCTACNYIGCSMATRRIFHSGSVGRFGIIGPAELPFLGDDITLNCAASIYAMTKLSWDTNFAACYKNGKMTNPDIKAVQVMATKHESHRTFLTENKRTRLMVQNVLHLTNVTKCHARSYSCLGQTKEGNVENVSYDLQIGVPRKPYFTNFSLAGTSIPLNDESSRKKNQSLTCCANGDPYPNVTWFENDRQLKESPRHHFILETCQLIVVVDLRNEKSKRYTCKADNRFGHIENYVEFVITGIDKEDKKMLYVVLAFVFILIGVAVAWFVVQKRRKERARQKFKEAILARFDKGASNYVQLNVNTAAQAEALPFAEKWEYPRKQLKFDKILGSGAFGLVRRAKAKSICRGKSVTTVAVKMVCRTHQLHCMTALIRELEVLVYLGSHLNVVNLLGTCTVNISYGELLVIVEYCRFGNLRDYLLHRRADFIDKIDSVTEKNTGPNLEMDRSDFQQNRKHVTDRNDDPDPENSHHSTDATKNTANVDDEAPANSSVRPGLRNFDRSDEPDLIVESICTKDLLCWAWQVSCGMRYLGLRKVVHGDLAARNVLLADNNVVKICDFGLAEILCENTEYKKSGDDPLPLQWMAIESIESRVFSTKSDVWSFGIFVWELFTLCETPYYGVNPRHILQKLRSGYRLSRPKYASEKIYHMMMTCWKEKPEQRPEFARLEDDLAGQLDNGIHTYYKDMSPEYNRIGDGDLETEKIYFRTMDPSQVTQMSSSTSQERLGLSNLPSSQCRDSAGPSTSRNVSIALNDTDS